MLCYIVWCVMCCDVVCCVTFMSCCAALFLSHTMVTDSWILILTDTYDVCTQLDVLKLYFIFMVHYKQQNKKQQA